MQDVIKRALTRRRRRRGGSAQLEAPDSRLVLGVKFAIGMTVCLSALEVSSLAFMHTWNSEVFAAITGLCGTVMGIFVGQKT
jgi:hypothetical protein